MSKPLNDKQRRMAETLDGMVVVDAGPGTGKTKTVVNRYINLISQKDAKGNPTTAPKDILLLTFTRNAAQEMENRIKDEISHTEFRGQAAQVRVQTFDSFCLSVVRDFPDIAGRLFGIEPKLTRSVGMDSSDTLNRRGFMEFLDRFIEENGGGYGDWSAIAQSEGPGLYDLIGRMLSRGVYPLKSGGWFGDTAYIEGDRERLLQDMLRTNELSGRQKASTMQSAMKSACKDVNAVAPIPRGFDPAAETLPADVLSSAVNEDRSEMIRLIHDIYLGYVEDRIASDRLTFGIAAMLAFSILYYDKEARRSYSFKYLMIDEFQDTNAAQLMMSLMILKEPNLCVVGDWRQGIYGFRYVSIEYILKFEEKVAEIGRMLNEDGIVRMAFDIPEAVRIRFDTNYRSSQIVVDTAFRCLSLKATDREKVVPYAEDGGLASSNDPYVKDSTEVRYLQAASQDREPEMVERCIREYVGSGRYSVVTVHSEDDGRVWTESRPMRLSDIAVLCRSTKACREVVDRLERDGVPVYLQGDVEIMSTREGKLALAWLRYVSNDTDPRGIGAIMADLGYSLEECKAAVLKPSSAPGYLVEQREALRRKRRRVNELLTSIFSFRAYGISNDVSQAIVNVLSGMHSGSLLTISDLITLMEEDIGKTNGGRATYPVETSFGSDAVTVMTMHKAKGLEFPAVIIPYVDSRVMPSTKGDGSSFIFDRECGIRCTRAVGRFQGYSKICSSWRTALCKAASAEAKRQERYDEERRLLFVAMSRAKQYETVICGPKPSEFMKGLCEEPGTDIGWYELPDATAAGASERPDLSGYTPRRKALSVHDLMVLDFGNGRRDDEADEISAEGRGKEYGTKVHKAAEDMHNTGKSAEDLHGRGRIAEDLPECGWIASNVLSRIRDPWGSGNGTAPDYRTSYAETGCTLPLDDPDVVVRGVIDLLIVFDDRIEIHDYKTDGSRDNEDQYMVQLSVYARAAESYYKMPVRCYIDYAFLRETVEFDPLPIDIIREKAVEALERLSQPPTEDDADITGESGIE